MTTRSSMLDERRLAELVTPIGTALRGMFAGTPERGGVQPSPAALQRTFLKLFGDGCGPADHRRFVLFAAPLMRAIVLEYAALGQRTDDSLPPAADLGHALRQLDEHDAQCARLIDLHYFCGFSPLEAAAVLELPMEEASGKLRFGRAWLQARGMVR